MLAFSFFVEMKVKNRIRRGKKAFITSAIVDMWAYIMFVVVVIVFALIYKWTAEGHLEELESVQDISYGNYLTHVYLRTPVEIGGTEMTMAELIAIHDYSRSVLEDPGAPDPVGDDIRRFTDDFVDKNFPEDNSFVFIIRGSAFEYAKNGKGISDSLSVLDAISTADVSVNHYVTYIPSVDPTRRPIEIYCFYDLYKFMASLPKEKQGVFSYLLQ